MYPREYFDTFWRGSIKKEVFVVMSFAEEFQDIWQSAIKPAIESDACETLSAHRVDATTISGSIMTEIIEGVAHAKLIFADISIVGSGKWAGQRNGNAMYELGLAHAIRQAVEVIIVKSDHDVINFDVAGIKVQNYDKNNFNAARKIFSELINSRLSDVKNYKSLKVEQAVNSLDQYCLTLILDAGKKDYFSIPDPKNIGEIISLLGQGWRDATAKMLSLGMLRWDAQINSNSANFAYHWTDFGKAVLVNIGARQLL